MVSGRVERGNSRGEGTPDQHESDFGEVGVVSVPLKTTSSDLNRVDSIKREEDLKMQRNPGVRLRCDERGGD